MENLSVAKVSFFLLPVTLAGLLGIVSWFLYQTSNEKKNLENQLNQVKGKLEADLNRTNELLAKVTQERDQHIRRIVKDERPQTEYEVIVDIDTLRKIQFKIFSLTRDIYKEYREGFQCVIVATLGSQNAGKTHLLGRLFNCHFTDESLIRHTPSIALRRFDLILVVDLAGVFQSTNFEDESALLDCYSQEILLQEIGFRMSTFLILVFENCFFDTVKKMLEYRRRAFAEKKKLLVVINWKSAKTNEEIQTLYKQEILKSFEGENNGCGPQPSQGDAKWYYVTDRPNSKLAGMRIYWMGDDNYLESRDHNDKILQELRYVLNTSEPFRQLKPLDLVTSELGVPQIQETQQVQMNRQVNSSSARTPALLECFEESNALQIELKDSHQGEEPRKFQDHEEVAVVVCTKIPKLRGTINFNGRTHKVTMQTASMDPEDYVLPDQYGKLTKVLLPSFRLVPKPLPDDAPPFTFTCEILDGGRSIRLRGLFGSGSSYPGLVAENSSNLGQYKAKVEEKIQIEGYIVLCGDFIQGELLLWWVKKEEEGHMNDKARGEVAKFRGGYLSRWGIDAETLPAEGVICFNFTRN